MHICIYTHKCKYIGEILPHFTFTLMPGFIPCNASSNQAWSYSCAHIIEKCQARTDYVLLTCAMLLSFMHCSICSKYMFKHMTVIPREFWFISNHVIIMGFIFQLDLFWPRMNLLWRKAAALRSHCTVLAAQHTKTPSFGWNVFGITT